MLLAIGQPDKRITRIFMPFASKNPFTRFPTLPTLVTLAAGGVALAVPFYRRPIETMTNLARITMLLRGVREATCEVDGFLDHRLM
jgi:hypothetical protein